MESPGPSRRLLWIWRGISLFTERTAPRLPQKDAEIKTATGLEGNRKARFLTRTGLFWWSYVDSFRTFLLSPCGIREILEEFYGVALDLGLWPDDESGNLGRKFGCRGPIQGRLVDLQRDNPVNTCPEKKRQAVRVFR